MAIEKKTRITVRFKPEDEKQIVRKAKAKGLGKSTYIRELALGNIPQDQSKFSAYENTEALQNLRKELLRIGTNINQIARVANTSGNINPTRLDQIKRELGSVNNKILDALL